MKFCVQCGTQLTEGAAFCTSCGTRVAADHAHDPSGDAPTQMARPVADSSVRLPGASSPTTSGHSPASTDHAQAAGHTLADDAPLGATAYPAPPSDGAAPSRLGAQYDWAQTSSSQGGDLDATQQMPQTNTSAQPHTSSEAAATSGDAHGQGEDTHGSRSHDTEQRPLGQQFSPGYASAPQAGDPSAPHGVDGQQADATSASTSAAPSAQGQAWGQQNQTDASAQPPMTQPIAQPTYDSTQQMPQHGGGRQFSSQPTQNPQHSGEPSPGPSYASAPQQGYASQGYASAPPQGYASQSYPSQGYVSQEQGAQGHASQGYAQQAPAGYASAPYASNAPQGAQAGMNGMSSGAPYGSAPQGVAQMQRPALDWKALTPGLLRLLAAITLALTALGNWWTSDEGTAADQVSTVHSVFGLIGCIGVVLACVAQVAVLPQFLGAAMQPIARFAVRAVLCLPALIAVIIAIVTTLGGPDSTKTSYVGVTMLAMAIGFALAGLDDARPALPTDVLRWVTVGLSGLGIVLTALTVIQSLSADNLSGKGKWLGVVPSDLGIIAVAGLVIWVCLKRPAFGRGLLVALAGSVAFSLATRGWIADDRGMAFVSFYRQGHGAALIALALALATAAEVASTGHDTATDDGSVARRLTQWVVPGFAVAGVGALITAFFLISGRDDSTPGGITWYLVLMFITALVYGACAFLLKTNPMGRLVAVVSTVTLSLTILITLAAAKGSGTASEAFTEGAYLWLPLVAAAALTIPPAVRRVAGPIAPQARPTAAPLDAQGQQAPGQQFVGQQGQPVTGQQFQSEPFQAQQGQAPQQWNSQNGQG